MKLKFERLDALPGFFLGYRTTVPHLGVVDLVVVGTGDVAVDLQVGDGHTNLAYVMTMDQAKQLCEQMARDEVTCKRLRSVIDGRLKTISPAS